MPPEQTHCNIVRCYTHMQHANLLYASKTQHKHLLADSDAAADMLGRPALDAMLVTMLVAAPDVTAAVAADVDTPLRCAGCAGYPELCDRTASYWDAQSLAGTLHAYGPLVLREPAAALPDGNGAFSRWKAGSTWPARGLWPNSSLALVLPLPLVCGPAFAW